MCMYIYNELFTRAPTFTADGLALAKNTVACLFPLVLFFLLSSLIDAFGEKKCALVFYKLSLYKKKKGTEEESRRFFPVRLKSDLKGWVGVPFYLL